MDEPRLFAMRRQVDAKPAPISGTIPPLLLCFFDVRFLLATRSILGGEIYRRREGAPFLDFDNDGNDHRLSAMFLPYPRTDGATNYL